MSNPINSKRILLGVSGSIACYKATDLASKLTQEGAQVDVVLTESAGRFVTPLSFQSVTGRKAYTDTDLWGTEGHVLHIGLAQAAELLVIAPATANTLAKIAHGLADNLLCVTALATQCPILFAPAMDGGMYAHPATQNNLEILQQRGGTIIGPAEGHLASGLYGPGRMVEPVEILGHIRLALSAHGPLKGSKVVVTAAGTQEPIDPVRSITNRSSGKQGYALAQAALDMGAQVVLISGPTHLATPIGAQRVDVKTADEMLSAVLEVMDGADALLMAAAVADFKPVHRAEHKIKKDTGVPTIELTSTPDILSSLADHKSKTGYPRVTVGFAAESQQLLKNARAKLTAKNLDLILANDISAEDAGFSVDTNRVTVLDSQGAVEEMPLLTKTEVAQIVLDRVLAILDDQENSQS